MLKIDAINDNLGKVNAFVDGVLEENDCSLRTQMQVDLVVEEVFVNIARYASGDEIGEAEISADIEDGVLTLVFRDSGVPYNPLEKDDPDITLSADEREIGGLGIFLVKKNMDEVSYDYVDGHNVFTMKKRI